MKKNIFNIVYRKNAPKDAFIGSHVTKELSNRIALLSLLYGKTKSEILTNALDNFKKEMDIKTIIKEISDRLEFEWESIVKLHFGRKGWSNIKECHKQFENYRKEVRHYLMRQTTPSFDIINPIIEALEIYEKNMDYTSR